MSHLRQPHPSPPPAPPAGVSPLDDPRWIEAREADTDLLITEEDGGALPDPSREPAAVPAPRPEPELPEIPGYEVQRLLGEGGMGRVYLANQVGAGRRPVAIKVIRDSRPGLRLDRRFQAEHRALSRLNHPAIAQLYGAGRGRDGGRFVVMEYVDGEPITRFCDARKLGLRARLELFVAVCHGVEHAHRRQLLHRDLKPSNLLVTRQDGAARPKIIDFGIARVLDGPVGDSLLTGAGLVGTPAYMSPEAIRPCEGPRDLDTRADVYSLGVVLYELLVGVRPHDADTETDPLTLMHRVLEDEVPRPSHRWESLTALQRRRAANNRGLGLEEGHRALSGDLDWILLQAIAKDREQRYGSVAELAADVERHLHHQPVAARPPNWRYRAGKFVRRHRAPVVAATIAVLALVAGILGTSVAMLRAQEAAQQEMAARQEAEAVAQFLTEIFRSSAVNRSDVRRAPSEITARDLLDEGAAQIGETLEGQPLRAASLRGTLAEAYRSLGLYPPAQKLLETSLEDLAALPPIPEVLEHRIQAESELGQIAHQLARPEVALGHLERAAALARDTLTEPNRSYALAQIADRFGRVYRRQARWDEAEEQHRIALELLRETSEPSPDLHLSVVSNLGTVYFDQRRWEEAAAQFEEALPLARKVLGADHARTASVLDNLAAALASQGRLDDAAPRFAEALAIRRTLLSGDHPALALSLNNLGTLALDRRLPAEAETLHREALEIRQRAYGPNHPSTAWSHHGVARALDGLGRHDEAAREMAKARDARRQSLPIEHPLQAQSVWMLGDFQRAAGRLDEAVGHYREALALLPSTPEAEADRAEMSLDLAEVLLELDRLTGVTDLLSTTESLLPASDELARRLAEARRRAQGTG